MILTSWSSSGTSWRTLRWPRANTKPGRPGTDRPESCIEAAEQRLSALPGTRGFERTELRGLPAYIVRASGTTLYDFSVTVFEGVTVSSEVAGYHVDEADVLEVAYSLRTVEPGDFIDYVSGDG